MRKFCSYTLSVLMACLLLLAAFVLIGHHYLIANDSPSVPVGWYVKTTDPTAPFAWVCLQGSPLAEARRHGLPLRGVCPDTSYPLLKPVYPPTKEVVFTPAGFVEDGKLLPNTKAKVAGVDGLSLTHFPYGRYQQSPDEIWPISTFNANSFDARYYGPLKKSQILSYARPFLIAPRGMLGTSY